MKNLFTISIAIILSMNIYFVQAQDSIYEPFDYVLNSELDALGEVGNGWGSSWTVYEGTSANMTIQAPAEHSGVSSLGNRLVGNLTVGEGLRASRLLDPRWEDTGDTIWLSFFLEIDNPSSLTDSWQGISLFSGSDERVLIGKDWGKDELGFNGFLGSSFVSSTSAYTGAQVWMVFKIETSGDASNENAYLWINPDPTKEPNVESADIAEQVQINGGLDKIVCHLGNTIGITCAFDEIRLSHSFYVEDADTTETSPIISTESISENLHINYNRNNKMLFITSELNDYSVAQLKMVNMSGISCYNETIKFEKGRQKHSIDLNNKQITPGIYIISLIIDSEIYSQKILLQ